jgi:hypothetical protein
LLGKTILFADNDHWSDAEIVRGYRAQHHLESAFRQMKDPHHLQGIERSIPDLLEQLGQIRFDYPLGWMSWRTSDQISGCRYMNDA